MRRWRAVLPLGFAAALGSCSSGPQAGDLLFELVSPHTTDGAVRFTLAVAEPQEIIAVTPECTGCQIFLRAGVGTISGVVLGDLGPGALLRATVSDVTVPDAYAGDVIAVAARNYQLRDPSGYRLRVVEP